MKKMRWLAVLLALVMVAAACGSDDAEETTDGGDTTDESTDGGDTEEVDVAQSGDLTFYMITHSDDGPFWSVLKRGAEAAAADVGVEMVWQGSNNDANVQAEFIDAAVAAGADGIGASLPNVDAVRPGLEAAVAAGIPVYTINSGVNDYTDLGATTHVGQTEVIAGNGAGLRFNDAGATKILCGRQEPDNGALIERCDGLAETFSGEVVSEFMDLDADQAAQEAAINAALSADPDFDGFMGVGPVIAMSGLRAADALGRDLTIGG
ncbi:MAG: substrate-binding domain-containing protein, partial [Acidimicrobiales bacterium]